MGCGVLPFTPQSGLCSGFFWRVLWLCGQNSVDAAALEVDDFKAPVGQFDDLPLGGQLAQGVHEQARQGVVAVFVFGGQLFDVQARFEFVDGHDAVEQPAAVFVLGGPGVGLGVGLELSGDGFEQVERGEQALHFAVFVDHKEHAAGLVAHLFEQLHAGQGFGHKVGSLGVVFEWAVVALWQRQQVR